MGSASKCTSHRFTPVDASNQYELGFKTIQRRVAKYFQVPGSDRTTCQLRQGDLKIMAYDRMLEILK